MRHLIIKAETLRTWSLSPAPDAYNQRISVPGDRTGLIQTRDRHARDVNRLARPAKTFGRLPASETLIGCGMSGSSYLPYEPDIL